MSHIEDPTAKVNVPTPLLKAIGEAHMHSESLRVEVLVGASNGRPTEAKRVNVLDYARETRQNTIELHAGIAEVKDRNNATFSSLVSIEAWLDQMEVNLTGTCSDPVSRRNYEDLCAVEQAEDLQDWTTRTLVRVEALAALVGTAEVDEAGGLIRHGDFPAPPLGDGTGVLIIPDDQTITAEVLRSYAEVRTESGKVLRGKRDNRTIRDADAADFYANRPSTI